jgi:hypothetical protein
LSGQRTAATHRGGFVNALGDSRSVIVPEGGLLRLVETEARLAQALAAAEAEAVAMVRAARAEAAEMAALVDAQIEAEAGALALRVTAERDAEIRRIAAEAERRCRRLQGLSAATVDDLAAEIETRLLTVPADGPLA